MSNHPAILFWALFICVPMTIAVLVSKYRAAKRERAKLHQLWETGATRLLGQVFGLSNDPQPEGMPVIGEPAQDTRSKILKHIWRSDQTDKPFKGVVCGEAVEVVLKYPNILFGFVEHQATLDAIQAAHDVMTDKGQQLFVGTIPLKLDIRVITDL